ncbi:hypothetical protein CLOM_g24627 [Closterium sp. NIES-68]|nr:hypothetical protein CLOM_g9551 [Closterium sp. NIES-68]GJP40355.1 hypothetical protein CLOM_g24627 [Closterium sp. NIES-68]GJP75571.1 hypothetical protein CLOP_g6003 [Closterium sp. NIES-67]
MPSSVSPAGALSLQPNSSVVPLPSPTIPSPTVSSLTPPPPSPRPPSPASIQSQIVSTLVQAATSASDAVVPMPIQLGSGTPSSSGGSSGGGLSLSSFFDPDFQSELFFATMTQLLGLLRGTGGGNTEAATQGNWTGGANAQAAGNTGSTSTTSGNTTRGPSQASQASQSNQSSSNRRQRASGFSGNGV